MSKASEQIAKMAKRIEQLEASRDRVVAENARLQPLIKLRVRTGRDEYSYIMCQRWTFSGTADYPKVYCYANDQCVAEFLNAISVEQVSALTTEESADN